MKLLQELTHQLALAGMELFPAMLLAASSLFGTKKNKETIHILEMPRDIPRGPVRINHTINPPRRFTFNELQAMYKEDIEASKRVSAEFTQLKSQTK